MEDEMLSIYCLFCVSDLTSAKVVAPSFLPWKSENSAIHEQLKSFFILRKVLKIPKPTLCQLFRENHHDIWSQVHVCVNCDRLVNQYYQAFTQKPRLECEMERTEKELRAKIHESKDEKARQRSSFFWSNVRNQLITGDSPTARDDDKSSTEYPQVKLEVSETPDYQSDVEYEFNSGPTPFSVSEDEEEYNIGETIVKVEVLDSAPTSLPLSEDSSDIRVLHICAHCPYKTTYLPKFELHLKAHLPGSLSVCCPDCGCYVLQKRLAQHNYNHRKTAKKKIARLEAKPVKKAPKKIRGKVPPPPYTLIKEKKGKVYQCRDCPYKIYSIKLIETHILLHERGSGAIPCPDCSCYYPLDNLERHRTAHRRCNLPKSIRRVTPYKKEGAEHECPKCPFRNAQKALVKSHLELHEPGFRAEVCKDCGVFVRSMEKHVMYCDKGVQDNSLNERNLTSRKTNNKKMRDVDSSNPNYFSFKRGKMHHKMYQCRHCDFRTYQNLAGMETHVEQMHGNVEDSVAILEPELEASSLVEVKVEDATADDDDYVESAEPKPGEVCNVGETVVKTEVVDLGHFSTPTFSIFEEQEESDPVPTLPVIQTFGSASDFCYSCPYCPFKHNLTRSFENHMPVHATSSTAVPCPDCGVYIFPENLVEHRKLDLKRALAPPKVRKTSVRPKKTKKKKEEVIPIPNPNYSIHKEKGESVMHKCHHCPFTVKSSLSIIEEHVKLHEPGAQAEICEECGFYVLPGRMKMHVGNRHPQLFKKARSNPKEKNTPPPPNPNFFIRKVEKSHYITHKEKHCRHCLFTTLSFSMMENHIRLHEQEDSGGAPCEDCGVFLLPEQLEDETNHRVLKTSRSFLKSLRCAECPYQGKVKRLFEAHLALHKEDSGAISCGDCGCYIRPELASHHRHFCLKWREGNKLEKFNPEQDDLNLKKEPTTFKCSQCPYECNIGQWQAHHRSLHLEGSGALQCPNCDVYYRPTPKVRDKRHICGKWRRRKIIRLNQEKWRRDESSNQLLNDNEVADDKINITSRTTPSSS